MNSPEAILAVNSALLFSARISSMLFTPSSIGSGLDPFEEEQVIKLHLHPPTKIQQTNKNPQKIHPLKLKNDNQYHIQPKRLKLLAQKQRKIPCNDLEE